MAFALDTQDVELAFNLFGRIPGCGVEVQVNDMVLFDPAPLLALPGATEHPGSAVALMAASYDPGSGRETRSSRWRCATSPSAPSNNSA